MILRDFIGDSLFSKIWGLNAPKAPKMPTEMGESDIISKKREYRDRPFKKEGSSSKNGISHQEYVFSRMKRKVGLH